MDEHSGKPQSPPGTYVVDTNVVQYHNTGNSKEESAHCMATYRKIACGKAVMRQSECIVLWLLFSQNIALTQTRANTEFLYDTLSYTHKCETYSIYSEIYSEVITNFYSCVTKPSII